MNRKSIAQEYYILVTDKYGMLPAMNREEAGAGLAAAAFMELLAAGVIEEEKKKTVVVKDLPAELEYLRPLYIYLREKHRYANRIMTDWHSGSRCRQLMELIGRSLQEAGLAKAEEGGLFRPKQVYIPEKKYKEELIGTLKAAIAEEEEMTSQDMALLCILKESRNLNPFFSKDEKHRLRKRIKELRQNPGNKKLAEMIGYITYMEDMAMYVFLAGIVSN